jgi:hypothetical protein
MACVRDPLDSCYLYQGGDLDFLQGARLREQTGQKLGHYTGGEGWEKNQDRDWDIKQGVELGKKSGRGLGYQTGGGAGKRIRVDTDISQRVDLRRIPGRLVNPKRPPFGR